MPSKSLRKIPLPHSDIIRAIGRIAITWSYIERAIELCIWELSGLAHQHTGEAVTAQLGLRNRIEILQSLINEKIAATETGKSLSLLSQQINNDLASKRNRFIHGTWISTGGDASPSEPELINRKARGKVIETRVTFTADSAIAIADEIEACFWRLWDLYDILLKNRVRGASVP